MQTSVDIEVVRLPSKSNPNDHQAVDEVIVDVRNVSPHQIALMAYVTVSDEGVDAAGADGGVTLPASGHPGGGVLLHPTIRTQAKRMVKA